MQISKAGFRSQKPISGICDTKLYQNIVSKACFITKSPLKWAFLQIQQAFLKGGVYRKPVFGILGHGSLFLKLVFIIDIGLTCLFGLHAIPVSNSGIKKESL